MFSYITNALAKENATFHGIIGPEKSDEAEVIAYISGQKKSALSVLVISQDNL